MKDNIDDVFTYVADAFREEVIKKGYKIIGKVKIMPIHNYTDPLRGTKFTIIAKVEKAD